MAICSELQNQKLICSFENYEKILLSSNLALFAKIDKLVENEKNLNFSRTSHLRNLSTVTLLSENFAKFAKPRKRLINSNLAKSEFIGIYSRILHHIKLERFLYRDEVIIVTISLVA